MKSLSDGRVRRTKEEWQALITRQRSSGLSEVSFCKREKVSRQSFRTWKDRFSTEVEVPGFVELDPFKIDPEQEPPSRDFELCLPGGVTIRWSA